MLSTSRVELFRLRRGEYGTEHGENFGAFLIPGPNNRALRVIASEGDSSIGIEWEHVSVSLEGRCPNWPEMCFIKDLFWDEADTVVQFHPAKAKNINNHAFCLHMWRPLKDSLPLPPAIAVGISGITHDEMAGMSTEAIEALKALQLERGNK